MGHTGTAEQKSDVLFDLRFGRTAGIAYQIADSHAQTLNANIATRVLGSLVTREMEILDTLMDILVQYGTRRPVGWHRDPLEWASSQYAINRQTQAEEITRIATNWGGIVNGETS